MRINYETTIGTNCILSSFANALRMVNKTIDDSAIFFLQDGFNITYQMKNYENEFVLRFSHHFDMIIESFMKKYYIKYNLNDIPQNFNEFLDLLGKRLEKNQPFLMYANSINLKYNEKFIRNKERIHAINLIGMNDEGILVSDSYVPTFPPQTYEGTISFAMFEEIFEWNKQSQYKYYDIEYDTIDKEAITISGKDLKEALNCNMKNYFNIDSNNSYLRNLHIFHEDLKTIFLLLDIMTKLEELSYKIFVESIIPARKLLKKALLNLSNQSVINMENSIIEELDNNIRTWNNVTLMIIKGGLRNNEKLFHSIYEKVGNHIAEEEKLFERIYNLTNN